MSIIIECQSVVTDVMCRITGFLHSTDRHGLNQILFLLSMYIIQQMVDGFWNICFCSACTYLVAEAGDELWQILQFLWIRQIVDTVGQYFRLFVFGYMSYLLCYGFVGKKHKFFYQFIKRSLMNPVIIMPDCQRNRILRIQDFPVIIWILSLCSRAKYQNGCQ